MPLMQQPIMAQKIYFQIYSNYDVIGVQNWSKLLPTVRAPCCFYCCYLIKLHYKYIQMNNDENMVNMNVQFGNESVNYFYKQGKLTKEQYDQISSVIKSLFGVISQSIKNFNTLNETARVLRKEFDNVKHEHQSTNEEKVEVSESTEKLSRALKSAEVAYDSQRASFQNLFFESEELEKEVSNRKEKMNEEFRMAEEKMKPMKQKYEADIMETKHFNQKTTANIESLQKTLESNMDLINKLKKENRQLQEQEEKLKEIELKIKDSPDHYAKSAENLHIEIVGMTNQIKDLSDEIERKAKIVDTFKQKKKMQEEEVQRLIKEKEADFLEVEQIETYIERKKLEIKIMENNRKDLKIGIIQEEQVIENCTRQIRSITESLNKQRKQIDRMKKGIKKQETVKQQNEELILETEMIIEKFKRQSDAINTEIRGQIGQNEEIKQDTLLVKNKIIAYEDRGKKGEASKKEIESKIKNLEDMLIERKALVNNTLKQIKVSTAVRQSMARKASVATNQVRQTREQLKVKQLLILDLTKKYQETENKLEHFKALYEEVKSARNKYVNLIQNSSQDLAELKERIKVMQNELEILKNESIEKNKTIQYSDHMLQLEIHTRDQTKAKLNQYDLVKKQKKECVDQNINEIEKLNMIILSLQKDMQSLRVQYEEACENRNYTGIQLIDRNDELCILYEKSNVQENILRKSQVAVKGLEDEIRMILIHIAEMQRKIKVSQQMLYQVPKYASRVIELQQLIQETRDKENELSKQLEDPENKNRWRQLEGEDPDEEALDAKISILQERLNSKKEQLLEKQLILDEVTNLSENLKKDAINGRQSTLQVSEKINEFQSRLRDLTRKMKATISELSMCQANIIKYQNEKQELEKLYEGAKVRMEEGLPPTPETEIEYLKMMRDKKRYQEERELRLQKEMIEQNYPPFATKTTAQQRANSYIPDEIGLPKPYGKNAPFMYQEPGSNMRHFRKPKVKEIQI